MSTVPTPSTGDPLADRASLIAIPPSAFESHEGAVVANGEAVRERLPQNLKLLFAFAPFIALVPNFGNNLSNYFSAIQAQQIDDAGKVGALAIISSVSAVAAMLAQPIVGVLSDRTRSRFGRRVPWIMTTALIASFGLITAGLSTSIALLTVGVTIVQFGFNAMVGPVSAILPDRVPTRFRGRYSTLAGLGTLIGGIGGSIFGSIFRKVIPLGYASAAGLALLITILFVTLVKDKDNREDARNPFSPLEFVKAFWVNPVKYPDFFFGFLGRILLFGSYGVINTYMLYIVQDYIGLGADEAQKLVPLLGLISLPSILISTSISGPLSDRIGRRKPLVLVAGLIIVAAALVPAFSPTVAGLITSMVLIGFGFGTFIAVDQALMSSVLPNADRYGTDLGVLNLASTLPYVVGPAFAGAIIMTFHTYFALYIAVAIIATVGAVAVLGIKGVR